MKTLFFALILAPAFSMAADPACEGKVQALEQRGVNRQALEQAFRNTGPGEKLTRYLLLAEAGTAENPHKGRLQVVDLKTGEVKTYDMKNGMPNAPRGGPDYGRAATTFYGASEMDRNLKSTPRTPSLKNSLHVGKTDAQAQDLQDCEQWDKKTGNLCLSSSDYNDVKKMVVNELDRNRGGDLTREHQLLFTYPGAGTDAYFKREADRKSKSNICEYVQNIPGASSGKQSESKKVTD